MWLIQMPQSLFGCGIAGHNATSNLTAGLTRLERHNREDYTMAILNPKAQPEVTVPRVDPHVYEIGAAMFANAQQTASECEWLTSTVEAIAKAREDYEGGPFVVMYKVMAEMSQEKIDALPDPDVDSGNNPGQFKTRTVNSKGKPVVKTWNYYYVLTTGLPLELTVRVLN